MQLIHKHVKMYATHECKVLTTISNTNSYLNHTHLSDPVPPWCAWHASSASSRSRACLSTVEEGSPSLRAFRQHGEAGGLFPRAEENSTRNASQSQPCRISEGLVLPPKIRPTRLSVHTLSAWCVCSLLSWAESAPASLLLSHLPLSPSLSVNERAGCALVGPVFSNSSCLRHVTTFLTHQTAMRPLMGPALHSEGRSSSYGCWTALCPVCPWVFCSQ